MFSNELSSNKLLVRSGQNRPKNGIIRPRQKDSVLFSSLPVCMSIIRLVTREDYEKRREQCNKTHQNTEAQVFTVHRANKYVLYHILHPNHKYSHWVTQHECICARYCVEPFHSKTFICCIQYTIRCTQQNVVFLLNIKYTSRIFIHSYLWLEE